MFVSAIAFQSLVGEGGGVELGWVGWSVNNQSKARLCGHISTLLVVYVKINVLYMYDGFVFVDIFVWVAPLEWRV